MTPLHFEPADSRTLQVDLDGARELAFYWLQLLRFSAKCSELGIVLDAVSLTRSRSGKHWHAEIKMRKSMKLIERIALQAILGSDRSRELCNWERARLGSPHPVLFIKKGKPNAHKRLR
jgi:hypothetical protein